MRHAFWGLLVVAIVPMAVVAADDQPPIPWANKFFVSQSPPPVVVHDFGTVPWGTTLTHRFVMTNIYAVPMQIVKDPEVSCGCTRVVRYTQKLEPRETGFVDIEMDGRRFQGAKAVTITVRFGPKFQSTAILQVRAFGRTDVQINPGQINFGVVAAGSKNSQPINIQYTGQQMDWRVEDVDTSNAPSVIASVQRLMPQRGVTATIYQLAVSLKPDAEPGVLQDQIMLKTNDRANPVVIIPVSGTVQAPLLVVQGNLLKFDPIPVGKEIERLITVRGTKPFKVVKVDGEGDGLTVKYDSFPSPVHRLTIAFRPNQPGELRRKLQFTTDQKETASVTVEATAEPGTPDLTEKPAQP
jgi:hypothetical protein